MAARDSETSPESGVSGEGSKAKAGSGRGRPPPDAVARAMAEVEQTLQRLKQVRAERADAEQRFREELGARDARLAELEAEREGAAARIAEVEARLAGAAEVGAQRDGAVENLARVEHRLGEMEAALEAERAGCAQVESRLAEVEGAARAQAERFRDQLIEAEQRERVLAEARNEERREAEELVRQLREQLESIAGAAAARAAELEASLQKALEAVEAERGEAAGREAQLESRVAEAQRRGEEAEAAIAQSDARIGELERLLAEHAVQAEEAARNDAILSDKVAEQEAELVGSRARLAQVQGELAGARSEVEQRDRQLAQRGESSDAEVNGLRLEVEKLGAEAVELWSTLESSEKLMAEHQLVAAGAEQRAEAARTELTGALEAERGQVRELHEKLHLAADRLVELQASLDERDRMIERAGEGGGGAGPSPWADDRAELRRRRLRRCRELLRDRERRSGNEQRVLAQRVKQCDEVLGRRRELVEARQIIERTHKKLTSGRARSGAAAAVFFGLGVITVLSGLSWAIVTRTFPATYAASAVLAADFHGEAVQPGDLEAWQAFHEELLLDPNIMSRVAERMTQRGFADLGQPAVVKTMLEQEMTWSSPEVGKLAFELRGLGREATTRRLDTYVTTLVVEANALRQRRSEHSTTVVAEKARSGAEPLEDPRLRYAGIGLAGGTVVCFVLWFGIWGRMVRTKSAFEHAAEIDGLLEEAKWVDPIQQIINAREPGPDSKAA